MMTVKVYRHRMARSHFGREVGGAAHWNYTCTGPDTITMGDGRVLPRKFDNDSIVELRRVLKRVYGNIVEITETWKAE